jgi:transcriptional regulator with XRE-family HTH domain
MTLGEKIQLLRKQNNLSQERLAQQMNVSRQAVSKWELNAATPDTENVVQLSRLFKVSTDYLLNDDYSGDQDLPAVKQVMNEQSEYVRGQLKKNKTIYMIFGFASLFAAVLIFSIQFYISSSPSVTLSHWLKPLLFTLPILIITILSFALGKKAEEKIMSESFHLKESKMIESWAMYGIALGAVVGLIFTLLFEYASAVLIGIGLGGVIGIILDCLRFRVSRTEGKGIKKHHMYTLATATAYVAIYLICRKFLYHLYTPDWTANNILWIVCIISCIPGLFGAYRFSFITLAGYIAGVILGEIFGPTMRTVQKGMPPMPYHDGWFYCIATYLVSCMVGIAYELYGRRKRK